MHDDSQQEPEKVPASNPERVEPSFAPIDLKPADPKPADPKPAESPFEPKLVDSGREQLNALVAKLEQQIADSNAQRLRALADAENARKRAQRELEDLRRYGGVALARDVVPLADNLRRAIAAVTQEAAAGNPTLANLLEGMQGIERGFLAALEKHGVKQIAQTGAPFDANLHQAMLQVETAAQAPGTIVEIMQPGYVLHDRLLRPAMVSVAKAPASAAPSAAPSAPPAANGGAIDTTA
jgi:molecular chaperone GrpE